MSEMLKILNYVFALVLFSMGIIPLLQGYGILSSNPLSFISGVFKTLILLVSAFYLSIDGFGEEHLIKYLSLFTALIIALIVFVPIMNSAGWISFILPGFIYAVESYLYVLGGIFLIIGAFIHH